jgi:hypothetical protein
MNLPSGEQSPPFANQSSHDQAILERPGAFASAADSILAKSRLNA